MKTEEIKALFTEFEQAAAEVESVHYYLADVSKVIGTGKGAQHQADDILLTH
jgi:hypothetical protein